MLKTPKKLNSDKDFHEFHEIGYRNHRSGRSFGGMSLLVRGALISHFSIEISDSYHFWCKLNKELFNWVNDLYICFLYIPPNSATSYKSGVSLNFESLQTECASFDEKGLVLILGDFNGRTNDVNDFIENDE